AIPAGIAWGRVVDRLGPRRTLDIVLVLWMAVFATAAAIPVLGLPSQLIYVAGVAMGIGLAGLWSADRPLMARLAPPRYYGQFFGLYAMVGRFAAIIGPIMWGLIADPRFLGWGQPAAVMFLLVWVVVAFLVLRPVDDRPREWGPEDLPDFADAGERPPVASGCADRFGRRHSGAMSRASAPARVAGPGDESDTGEDGGAGHPAGDNVAWVVDIEGDP
ncbi:MAG: MFS transporter, partial [Chloroflexota bacterium]